MHDAEFKLFLDYITPDGATQEHSSTHSTFDEAFDEADDLAFSTVGFPLESWQLPLDFGNGRRLYYFYPNEEDRSSRYRLIIGGAKQ